MLLSVAAPFIVALAFVGKKLMDNADNCEKKLQEVYEKIIEDLVTAIRDATVGLNSNTEALEHLLDFNNDLKEDLRTERELRIRMEERLRLDDEARRRREWPLEGEMPRRRRKRIF